MARNGKNMTEIRNIIQRLKSGQSIRLIHKELGVHRTIIRELHSLAIAHQWINSDLPMPNDEEILRARTSQERNQAHALDPYRDKIKQWAEKGHSSVVIKQLLKDVCACLCDVQVVRRYRTKHFPDLIEPVMVRPTFPGRDMDVDFGELGRFLDDDNTIKRVWLFSLRLRHSGKTYREIVLDQTVSTFCMGHVHAFEYFNGVAESTHPDNLKAAVIQSNIDNDKINKTYQNLAEHYGFIISPCLPRTPEHKGGVEGDVKYAKRNFLAYFLAMQKEAGIKVPSIRDLIIALAKWDKEIADVHIIHGKGKSPREIFITEEAQAMKPLPKQRWEPIIWAQCEVRREWRIMFEGVYYSVPYHLIGKVVEVQSTSTTVRIYHDAQEVAFHAKASVKWQYQRKPEHAPPYEEAVLQCTREGLLILAKEIGPFTYQVSHAILSHPNIDKLRPVRYLLKLATPYSKERLEKACQRAFNSKLFVYSSIKNILEKSLDLDGSQSEKIFPIQTSRFARDPSIYNTSHSETFEEKATRLHPTSRHGNGMAGSFAGLMADGVMEEEEMT